MTYEEKVRRYEDQKMQLAVAMIRANTYTVEYVPMKVREILDAMSINPPDRPVVVNTYEFRGISREVTDPDDLDKPSLLGP